MKILLMDIENAPNSGVFWTIYSKNGIGGYGMVKDDWYMLSWSAKWLDGSKVMGEVLSSKAAQNMEDKDILPSLWKLLDEADVVVAHNGMSFDVPKINTRFLKAGMGPPSPYRQIDTLKVARRQFSFVSNRLDDLGSFLDLGRKVKHEGMELWLKCMKGDAKSLKKMLKYNKGDITLLEDIYVKLIPWIPNHPNWGMFSKEPVCNKCGSEDIQKRGTYRTNVGEFHRVYCNSCTGWSKFRTKEKGTHTPDVVGAV